MRPSVTRRLLGLLAVANALGGIAAVWLVRADSSFPAHAAWVAALSLFFSALVVHFFVANPIRDITRVLEDATHGDRLLRLDAEGTGEVGVLAKAVNHLVDQLEQREGALRHTLKAVDLAYRLAKVGTNSFDEDSAMAGVRDTLGDAYPGMHVWFVTPGMPNAQVPEMYRRLAAEAEVKGGLVHGGSQHAWQVAVPLAINELRSTVMLLYSAVSNEVPDDGLVQTIASHVTMVLASAANYRRATTDGLTGLHNKAHGADWIDQVLAESQRYGHVASVLALDIDHFKRVNDTYGHATGDEVLRAVAGVVRSGIRAADIGIRNGGEEFLVLLPHTRADQAVILAEKLRRQIADLVVELQDSDTPLRVTMSMGVAELQENESAPAWIDRADKALYVAKREGRNRVVSAS